MKVAQQQLVDCHAAALGRAVSSAAEAEGRRSRGEAVLRKEIAGHQAAAADLRRQLESSEGKMSSLQVEVGKHVCVNM